MNAFEDFGRVWMAASPLTERIGPIKRSIDAGADTIVLKTVTSIATDAKPEGKREIVLNRFIDYYGDRECKIPYVISSSATSLDCEMLTFERSNQLHDEIKAYSPKTKVIASFAPITADDFSLVDRLKGDAIEINTRWYDLKMGIPFFIVQSSGLNGADTSRVWQNRKNPSKIMERIIVESKEFEAKRKEKENAFRQGLQEVYGKRPILLKVSRQDYEMEMNSYMDMASDGITFSDSLKGGLITHIKGEKITVFGKGSISGALLAEQTLAYVHPISIIYQDKHVSASGGIITPEIAKLAIFYGAGSVQLCSAVYFFGYSVITSTARIISRPLEECEICHRTAMDKIMSDQWRWLFTKGLSEDPIQKA